MVERRSNVGDEDEWINWKRENKRRKDVEIKEKKSRVEKNIYVLLQHPIDFHRINLKLELVLILDINYDKSSGHF